MYGEGGGGGARTPVLVFDRDGEGPACGGAEGQGRGGLSVAPEEGQGAGAAAHGGGEGDRLPLAGRGLQGQGYRQGFGGVDGRSALCGTVVAIRDAELEGAGGAHGHLDGRGVAAIAPEVLVTAAPPADYRVEREGLPGAGFEQGGKGYRRRCFYTDKRRCGTAAAIRVGNGDRDRLVAGVGTGQGRAGRPCAPGEGIARFSAGGVRVEYEVGIGTGRGGGRHADGRCG